MKPEGEIQPKDLKEILLILKRRKTQIIVPFMLILAIGLGFALFWPPAYRSTATILIEEQELPTDLVRSTVTSYADQRIQTIKHQIMTRSTLWKMIEQYDLYPKMRNRASTEEIIKEMSKNISVDVISAEVVDRRTGQQTNATIAFTLSYRGENPQVTQKVANDLTSLFLSENLKVRERNVQDSSAFLKEEARKLMSHIDEVEKKIGRIKDESKGALPELIQFNMQLMEQTDREFINVDQEIRIQKERKISLEGQLATLKPNSPLISETGEKILDAPERLKTLKTQYISKSSYLSPEHPDLIKMKHEMEALEKEAGKVENSADLFKRLTDERANLAALIDRFGENHPDVVRTKKIISGLEKEIIEPDAKLDDKKREVPPENPAYINIQSQLASTETTLKSLELSRERIKAKEKEYADKIQRTPFIEQDYIDLIRDRDNSATKYNEIRSKLMEAKVSEGLESQHKGEKFSLIDPPAFPEKPESPNRGLIAVLGMVLAVFGGVGAGAVTETMDRSIRSPESISRVTRVAPLALIPYIMEEKEKMQQKRIVSGVVISLAILFAGALLLVHLFLSPLDVLGFVLLRKIGIQ
jgi:succinoglycan biosynthesis transport protein ExoP